MKICGLVKTTLLDFPGKIGCTVFTEGCDLLCPFCQNSALVLDIGKNPIIPEEEIFSFLEKRKNYLKGICITGGEPLLQPDIEDFIRKIRKIGYAIKLDTNGMFPEQLKHLIDEHLLDYIAMDIKTVPSRYWEATGMPENFDFSNVLKSVDIIKSSNIEHEFRTTAVKNFISQADFIEIAKILTTTEKYFIQTFQDKGSNISSGLQGYSIEEERDIKTSLRPFVRMVDIRG